MFHRKPTPNNILLDETIALTLADFRSRDAGDQENPALVDQITKLFEIRHNTSDRISKEVLLTVGGNLLGIFVIVGHERAHVVTSKAFLFVKNLL